MKTLITKFFAVGGMAIIMLASCKKDEIKTVSSTTGTGAAITLSTTTPTLTKATLANTALTITATQTSYGYDAAVTYALQLAVKGTNFAAPVEISLTKDALSKTYTVQDFNNLLLGMKLPVNVAAQVEVRLKTSLSATAGITYSSVATVTATPFPLTSWIYVVGAFQGWNEKSPDSLISVLGDGVYKGVINFTAGNNEFLILPAKSFSNKYATAGTVTPTASVGYNAANNLKAPATAGQYLVTLDLNTNVNTIAFLPVNSVYSVIGSTTAGGNFSTDVDLPKYVNDGVTGWSATITMTAGEFKFRQDHAWTYSWGDVATPNGKDLTNSGGGNIKLATAGTYKVGFYLAPGELGKAPATAATYTLVKQ